MNPNGAAADEPKGDAGAAGAREPLLPPPVGGVTLPPPPAASSLPSPGSRAKMAYYQ